MSLVGSVGALLAVEILPQWVAPLEECTADWSHCRSTSSSLGGHQSVLETVHRVQQYLIPVLLAGFSAAFSTLEPSFSLGMGPDM